MHGFCISTCMMHIRHIIHTILQPLPPPHSASCKTSDHLYVCTLVNAWLVEDRHHQYKLQQDGCKSYVHLRQCASWHKKKRHQRKLQILYTASASEIVALIDDRKNTTSASRRGSRPSWVLIGAGCSNQLQLAQGHKS